MTFEFGLSDLAARVRLRGCTSVGAGTRVQGKVVLVGTGVRRIGARVTFLASTVPIELNSEPGGTLIIGDDVVIEGGVSLWAKTSVTIGNRVRIGAFCQVMDDNFHVPGQDRDVRPPSQPVVIEDDVVLGPYSILIAGAYVARDSVVHSRTVVTRRLPPHSDVRGVPAMVRPREPS